MKFILPGHFWDVFSATSSFRTTYLSWNLPTPLSPFMEPSHFILLLFLSLQIWLSSIPPKCHGDIKGLFGRDPDSSIDPRTLLAKGLPPLAIQSHGLSRSIAFWDNFLILLHLTNGVSPRHGTGRATIVFPTQGSTQSNLFPGTLWVCSFLGLPPHYIAHYNPKFRWGVLGGGGRSREMPWKVLEAAARHLLLKPPYISRTFIFNE